MKPYTEIVPAIAVFSLLMFTVACTDANSPTPSSDRSQPDIATTAQESGSGDVAAGEGSSSGTIVIKTNKGEIIVELNREKAPITVANFLQYVDKGSYDGTIFHRVIPGFMIQGGGFDTDYKKRPADPPIKNEAGNGLANDTGTIAMARTSVVDSATAQFFINVVDNRFLNHKSDRANEYGYTVFGKVVGGAETVKSIETTPTENRGGPFSDAPVEQVVIESIRRK